MRLEVCIDSLESAQNAVLGGADELEVCNILTEGGLTPSPGLVAEVISFVNEEYLKNKNQQKCKVNIMIRCRSGSNFCYSAQEMTTMLADIEFYKTMEIDSFVFGALTSDNDIDVENCRRVINKAHPIPVTFHRAFDICKVPEEAITKIINLGFKRLLTSGQKISASEEEAKELIRKLLQHKIEIMPGSGVSYENVMDFFKLGCRIVHSSCKATQKLQCGSISMGSPEVYITSFENVRKIKQIEFPVNI
ncbi:copper homeostasis protein cutC homolog [Aricia agestis]|uniref:copper homeostasis protein cutC homolog n=1 Tax=Aricia agestis TaxID=91739 RepID=UPI001C20B02E|nr:copper homeostasis protein cutC homolog [Aricia agestis]